MLIICILVRVVLRLITRKYGKISYDGFSALGFSYNAKKDIFYSAKNAWQKNFGYTHAYDVLSPMFGMIIDKEQVKFKYDDKNWLIAFWKGQYGIVTGAEMGVYFTKQEKVDKRTVYFPVEDNEMLKMNLILYKNGKVIMNAAAKHWWLAIFKLGMFSNPKELLADIEITFLNHDMLESFLNSFKKLGYSSEDFKVVNNTFYFKFLKPHTRKVWSRIWIVDKIIQFKNYRNVRLYNKCLIDFLDDDRIDDSKIDSNKNLIMINELLPDLIKNKDESNVNILQRLFRKKEENIVFLHSNTYSESSENYYE